MILKATTLAFVLESGIGFDRYDDFVQRNEGGFSQFQVILTPILFLENAALWAAFFCDFFGSDIVKFKQA